MFIADRQDCHWMVWSHEVFIFQHDPDVLWQVLKKYVLKEHEWVVFVNQYQHVGHLL